MVANADSSNWLAGNLSSILHEEAKSASSHDGHIMLDNMNDAAFATSRRLTSTSARTLTAADASSSSSGKYFKGDAVVAVNSSLLSSLKP